MAKPRATTIQQRFGFKDDDLKKPDHDAIMLWIDQNAEMIIRELFDENAQVRQKIWEYPIMSGAQKQYCVGFIDMFIECTSAAVNRVMIEVKTTIPSLGELVRQIRLYQSYFRHEYIPFVIISPDDRFQSALESQGIKFYKYAGDLLDAAMM